MLRTLKCLFCAALLAMGGQAAHGFVPLGPTPGTGFTEGVPLPPSFGDNWETILIGYGLGNYQTDLSGAPTWLGDIGGPKNIGEEYRRNVKTLYYAYDENFADFFGAQGEMNVDLAFAMMNNVFTNYANGVDGYSADLTEFPLTSQHFNSQAENLYLTDIKSVTLHLLVEQMGLAEPERYTWTLHDRDAPPGCPLTTTYIVVQRNLGTTDLPLTGPNTGTQYSPYVNNILYTYGIFDKCSAPFPPWTAISIPFAVDTTAEEYTAVAANNFEFPGENVPETNPTGLGGLGIGGFYTGLTRDDVAGLRYLMTTNNINLETPGSGALFQATNDINNTTLLITANLKDLVMFSRSNAPAVVETNFPGVIVGSSTNDWIVLQVPNIVVYYTNSYYFGGAPVLVIKTNYTPIPVQIYSDTFANVITNTYSSNKVAYLQTVTVAQPYYYGGTGTTTNYSALSKIILTNVPSGDYYFIPSGTCGYNIVRPLYTNVTIITNIISNIATAPNSTSTTNYTSYVNLITYFTNHWFVVEPCFFQTNSTAKYQGIERLQFQRVADNGVDPLTHNFIIPITNTYTMNWYNPANFTVSTRTFRRIVTAPDILLTAADLADGPSGINFNQTVTRNINFNIGNILPNLAGPGTIEGETTFTYNKVGTAFWNGPFPDGNSFVAGEVSAVNETNQRPSLLWASYDGSTNTPIVYPNSLSIQQLENQMIITVSPSSLVGGINGQPYTPTPQPFTVTGGQAPYTWAIVAGALPNGLSLDPNTGILSGTPNDSPGIYDFTIQMTDSAARVVTLNYSIQIDN